MPPNSTLQVDEALACYAWRLEKLAPIPVARANAGGASASQLNAVLARQIGTLCEFGPPHTQDRSLC